MGTARRGHIGQARTWRSTIAHAAPQKAGASRLARSAPVANICACVKFGVARIYAHCIRALCGRQAKEKPPIRGANSIGHLSALCTRPNQDQHLVALPGCPGLAHRRLPLAHTAGPW